MKETNVYYWVKEAIWKIYILKISSKCCSEKEKTMEAVHASVVARDGSNGEDD